MIKTNVPGPGEQLPRPSMQLVPFAAVCVLCIIGLVSSVLLLAYGGAKGKVAVVTADKAKADAAQGSAEVANMPMAPARPVGRSGLAPSISPDGTGRLVIETSGSPDISVEHDLVIRKVKGGGKTVLLSSSDSLSTELGAISVHEWEPAGWSADGGTVYFASRMLGPNSGGGELLAGVYGNELHAVDVKTSKDTLIGTFSSGKDVDLYGLVAVAPVQKRVAYVDAGRLYLSGFADSSNKVEVSSMPSGKRVWQAMFDPKAERIAILLVEQKGAELVWSAGLIDEKGTWTDLGPSINGGLLDWTKEAGLTYLSLKTDGGFEEKTAAGSKE